MYIIVFSIFLEKVKLAKNDGLEIKVKIKEINIQTLKIYHTKMRDKNEASTVLERSGLK